MSMSMSMSMSISKSMLAFERFERCICLLLLGVVSRVVTMSALAFLSSEFYSIVVLVFGTALANGTPIPFGKEARSFWLSPSSALLCSASSI